MPTENPTPEEFRKLIEESNDPDKLNDARDELVVLLEADKWRIAGKAEGDGRRILAKMGRQNTQFAIVD